MTAPWQNCAIAKLREVEKAHVRRRSAGKPCPALTAVPPSPRRIRRLDRHGDAPPEAHVPAGAPHIPARGVLPFGLYLADRIGGSSVNAGCAAGVAAALLATTLLASSPAAQELVPFPVAGGDEPPPIVNAPVEAPPETAVAPAAAGPDLDAATAALVTMLTGPPAEGSTMADCAIELLRTRLASAVAGEDVLTAVALENELLRLCWFSDYRSA